MAEMRTIRDPIHGDIRLDPVQAAVVDTVTFQRLRYIRQNGLLHFVFPGAVHTRFIHSIGTMEIGRRVFHRLVRPICGDGPRATAIGYLETVFSLAGLLHDIGHCAFSHSIEGVELEQGPLLGSIQDLFDAWKENELLAEYLEKRDPGDAHAEVKHEEIGLILIRRIFEESAVAAACEKHLGIASEHVGRDVRALIDDFLPYSDSFAKNAEELCRLALKAADHNELYAQIDDKRFVSDFRRLLHSLVSGTLDIDRLDYLNRDSFFCGVPYGKCDLAVLINAMDIGGVGGETQLLLHAKATSALDDMLWSRYQLFIQVLNHKTNVALNKMLGDAIRFAIDNVYLEKPSTWEDYLSFTDDLVMSTVLSLCVKGGHKMANTPFVKTLARREIPLHLGATRLTSAEDNEVQQAQDKYIAETKGKLTAKDLIFTKVKSELVKKGPLPTLYRWNKLSKRLEILDLSEGSTILRKDFIVPIFRVLHRFVDREPFARETA